MQQEQLALFGDDQVVGSGKPHPWPVASAADETEARPAENPDQLAFADTEAEAA